MGAPMLGRKALELGQCSKCCVEIFLIAPADGSHVERLDVLGLSLKEARQVSQCVIETLGNNFVLDRSEVGLVSACLHVGHP